MHFTRRDHQTLQVLKSYAEDGVAVLPNRLLAKELGITPGAAVPRLDRLRHLGIIKVDYDINTYNGNVKQRRITIVEDPPEPFQKEKPKTADPEPQPETPPEVLEETVYEEISQDTADPTSW